MKLLEIFKGPASAAHPNSTAFAREIKHICSGPWHQYDILLATQGYGWDTMKEWADFMSDADLEHISQVTTSCFGEKENEITKSYIDNGRKCQNTPELEAEMGLLSVAGISKALKSPTKIVWINQTRVLRLFTLVEDELQIKKYVETYMLKYYDRLK